MRMQATRELLAPRPDAWGFVAEPFHLADWWPGVSGVQPDRRGSAAGARWEIVASREPTLLRQAGRERDGSSWPPTSRCSSPSSSSRRSSPCGSTSRRSTLTARKPPSRSRGHGSSRTAAHCPPCGRSAVRPVPDGCETLRSVRPALPRRLAGRRLPRPDHRHPRRRRHLGEGVRLRQRAVAFQRADRRSEEPPRLGDEAGGRTSRGHSAPRRAFVQGAYPSLMDSGFPGRSVGLVFAGPVDGRVRSLVEETLGDAGGPPPLRVRRSSSRSTCRAATGARQAGPRSPRSQRNENRRPRPQARDATSCLAATAPLGRRCRRSSSRSGGDDVPPRRRRRRQPDTAPRAG